MIARDYVINHYGAPPRWRWVMFMKIAQPFPETEGETLPEQFRIHNKYVGADVIKIHTMCGDYSDIYTEQYINLYDAGKKWENENPDTFLESVNDCDNPRFRDHYFKVVIDEEYEDLFSPDYMEELESGTLQSELDNCESVDDMRLFLTLFIDRLYKDPEDAIEAIQEWIGDYESGCYDDYSELVQVMLKFLDKAEMLTIDLTGADASQWYVTNRDDDRFYIGDEYMDKNHVHHTIKALGYDSVSDSVDRLSERIYHIPCDSMSEIERDMMLPPSKYWTDVMGNSYESYDETTAGLLVAQHRIDRINALASCDCCCCNPDMSEGDTSDGV